MGSDFIDAGVIEVKGFDAFEKAFRSLGPRITRKVLAKATGAAATPVLKAVRKSTPVRKTNLNSPRFKNPPGSLKRSWIKKTKRYVRSGTVVTLIGSESKKAPHAHLVESGTVDRWRRGRRGIRKSLGLASGRRGFSGKMPALRILQRAYERQASTVLNILTRKLGTELEKEAAKKA